MTRLHATIGLLICLLFPADVAAFWLADGQCGAIETPHPEAVSLSEVTEADCEGVLDPTDSSFNACFELAENPISTLPELIAQEQAERVVAALLETTDDVVVPADAITPLIPSPNEASVEDPELPGRPLVATPPLKRPRPTPNSCSAFPDDCENQPHVPTLNLEASSSPANAPCDQLEVPPAILPENRRGPPAPGVGPALGVSSRLDRPPQAG